MDLDQVSIGLSELALMYSRCHSFFCVSSFKYTCFITSIVLLLTSVVCFLHLYVYIMIKLQFYGLVLLFASQAINHFYYYKKDHCFTL